jgi:hypothetical protein
MEALYFRETELQELGYRLSLRVAKAMSKAGVVGAEVQRQVKVAYGIRSKHVHGSYLSANERKRNEKEVGRTLPALAMQLLDYLRMTIVHLLCSTQQKTSLLEMIEASFLSSEKDTELGALLAGEQNVLHSFSHQM